MAALVDTVRNMNRGSASALLGLASLLIVAFIVMALRMTTGAMAPLYTNLTFEDSAEIVEELEKSGVPYQILGNGSQILVPNDRVLRMRMSLASQGLPATGSIVGYEIFDRSETLGTSSYVMNINLARALEGELSRTISSITNVDSARVHLVFAKREIFSREKDKPTASVTIKMRGGKSLEKSEVQSITHMVASAVPSLNASSVTVVDSHGRLLARGDGDEMEAAVDHMQELQTSYEKRTRANLEELIEKVIGAGKVRVQVSADMNFDRVVTNVENYDPDGQVARSVQSNSERTNVQESSGSNNTSVSTNLPQSSSAAGGANNNTEITEQAVETVNYEISKTVRNHISEGGEIERLSVAVLLDGTYGENDSYTPRTEEELKQIRMLVSSAVGFDEKRGDTIEIVNMRFTNEVFQVAEQTMFQKFRGEAQGIIQTLIIAVVAILAILLVLRPAVSQLIKQSQSASQRAGAQLAALEGGGGSMQGAASAMIDGGGGGGMGDGGGGSGAVGDGGGDGESLIDVANIKGGMRASSIRKANEIIDQFPEETMNVVRGWMQNDS